MPPIDKPQLVTWATTPDVELYAPSGIDGNIAVKPGSLGGRLARNLKLGFEDRIHKQTAYNAAKVQVKAALVKVYGEDIGKKAFEAGIGRMESGRHTWSVDHPITGRNIARMIAAAESMERTLDRALNITDLRALALTDSELRRDPEGRIHARPRTLGGVIARNVKAATKSGPQELTQKQSEYQDAKKAVRSVLKGTYGDAIGEAAFEAHIGVPGDGTHLTSPNHPITGAHIKKMLEHAERLKAARAQDVQIVEGPPIEDVPPIVDEQDILIKGASALTNLEKDFKYAEFFEKNQDKDDRTKMFKETRSVLIIQPGDRQVIPKIAKPRSAKTEDSMPALITENEVIAPMKGRTYYLDRFPDRTVKLLPHGLSLENYDRLREVIIDGQEIRIPSKFQNEPDYHNLVLFLHEAYPNHQVVSLEMTE